MNIELFITLVKERPALYDLQNPLHKHRREKDNKWREICTAMDISMDVAKNKWRNLKDCFTKHLKDIKTASGQSSGKYFNWQWAKHMEFMKPHLNFALTSTNLDKEEHSLSNAQDTPSKSDVRCTQMSMSLQGTHSRSHRHSQRKRQTSSDSDNTFSHPDRIIHYLENKNNLDATELIFIGYAKSIKQFSIQRQARIKVNIAKMIAEEEVAHYEETMLRPSFTFVNQPSPNSNSDSDSKAFVSNNPF